MRLMTAGKAATIVGVMLAWTTLLWAGEEPMGHWRFDRLSKQSAGQGAVVHGATATDGKLGGAVELDGVDDYVSLKSPGELEAATIAFWMRPDDVDRPGWQGLVTSDAWEEGVFHIPMRDRRIDVYLHQGDARRGRLVSSPMENGRWYHVAITADVGEGLIRLFLNGYEEDLDDVGQMTGRFKLIDQVVGREFDGEQSSRYFQGAIDDVRIYGRALESDEIRALCADAPPPPGRDLRNIRTGHRIPDEGYCDQPYTVITADGNWLAMMTTGGGHEGQHGQHIVATISSDRGKTWSDAVDIEPADGPDASWVMPLVTRSGRVYGFYTYNGDSVRTWLDKPIRSDTVGWYCYKYSDDHGRTWSKQRFRLPLPPAPVDRTNTFGGAHQIFWGIGKPVTYGDTAWLAFSRCGKLVVDSSEGWFYRSDNILTEPQVTKIEWQLLPDGEHGLKNPDFGDVQAEQNLVTLDDGSLYCMYRTKLGYPVHAYSRDGGHTWTKPVFATYSPGGRKMKTPRACPRIWRTAEGKFLFWYHHHSNIENSGFSDRNPAWISGGLQRDGLIHWSQPEILLYDRVPTIRTSYPDLIEQDGRYWVTETQKSVARVHEVDKSLLEGLWSQGLVKSVTRRGLVLEVGPEEIRTGKAELPGPLDPDRTSGVSIDFWIRLDDLAAGQVLLDSRTEDGRGMALVTTESGSIRIELDDGPDGGAWDCDPGVLTPGKLHHVAVIVDAGPRIIHFVVDGRCCDGGDARTYGWGRYDRPLGDVTGSGTLRFGPSLHGEITRMRVYNRYLRTSEAIANFHAGPG